MGADARDALRAVEASLGDAAVDQGELADAQLPETVGAYTDAIDRDWDRYVRQGQPRG